MEESLLCRKLTFSQLEGSRKNGRQELRWLNDVLQDDGRRHKTEIVGRLLSWRLRLTKGCSAIIRESLNSKEDAFYQTLCQCPAVAMRKIEIFSCACLRVDRHQEGFSFPMSLAVRTINTISRLVEELITSFQYCNTETLSLKASKYSGDQKWW
jgi:hypothetical protein